MQFFSLIRGRVRSVFASASIGLAFVASGCQVSDPKSEPSSEYKNIEVDYFTVGYLLLKSNPDYDVELNDDGMKFVKNRVPESEIHIDGGYAYLKPEFRPSMWEAYLCNEKPTRTTKGIPESAPLGTLQFIADTTSEVEYLFIPNEPYSRTCSNFPFVSYDIERGFRFQTGLNSIATITIYYR